MAGSPHLVGTHLPIGDLKINFSYPQGEISDYRGELDLHTAINTVSYKVGNTEYIRQCIASNSDDEVFIAYKSLSSKSTTMELELKLLRQAM